jgi:hypothetical protein
VEIQAEDDDAALQAAMAYDLAEVTVDPEWENAVCKRIVHIEDPSGKTIHCDVPLDDYVLRFGGQIERRLCDSAPRLLAVAKLAIKYLDGDELAQACASIAAVEDP